MITLNLSEREVEVIRQALRAAEQAHTRNDFKALVIECQELRSKVSDAILDQATPSKSLV